MNWADEYIDKLIEEKCVNLDQNLKWDLDCSEPLTEDVAYSSTMGESSITFNTKNNADKEMCAKKYRIILEQNRRATQKYRERQKKMVFQMEEEIKIEKTKNEELQREERKKKKALMKAKNLTKLLL